MDPEPRNRARKKRKSETDQTDGEASTLSLTGRKQQNEEGSEQKLATSRRRKLNKLADLPGMPLDILFEIFGHLNPYDLLKLTRTNKDFRRLLLSRSSISVWKASLENVPGLPECPSEMNEPTWVNLVFSPYCHFCLTAYTKNVEWRFRLRICSKCSKEHLGELGVKIRHYVRTMNGRPNVQYGDLIPTRRAKTVVLCLFSQFEAAMSEYNALEEEEARKQYLRDRYQATRRILEHAKRCEAWAKSQGDDRQDELTRLREERHAAIIQKLEELGWGKDIASIRRPDNLATHKLVNRPQRLTERIWANIKNGVLEYMQQMREKRLKREFDNLVLKRKGIAMGVLRSYKNTAIKNVEFSESAIMPEPPDYCNFEPVKEILNQSADVEIDISSFDTIIPLLPGLIAGWRKRLDQSMLQVVKEAKSKESSSERSMFYDPDCEEYYYRREIINLPNMKLPDDQLMQKLKLAATVFACKKCEPSDNYDYDPWFDDDEWYLPKSMSKPLFYPQVLGHPCLTLQSSLWEDLDLDWFPGQERSDPSTALTRPDLQVRKQWACVGLKVDTYNSRKAEDVIKFCGLDPTTTTTEEMDNLDVRLACRLCPRDAQTANIARGKEEVEDLLQEGYVLPLFDWRAAVRHQTDLGHNQPSFIKFKREELSEDIILAESNHRIEHNSEWYCFHCRDTSRERSPESFEGIKGHFRTHHNDLPSPVVDQDCFRHFTAPDINASQPPLFVYSKDGQLSVFEPPVVDNDVDDSIDPNLVRQAREWRDAR